MEKKININIKKKKFDLNSADFNSSFENEKIGKSPKIIPDVKFSNGMETNNISDKKNKLINGVVSDGKIKEYIPKYLNKSNMTIKVKKYINNYNFEENDGTRKTYNTKNSVGLTESNFVKHKNDSKILIRNFSMNSYINNTFHNNIDNSIVTNNNNVLLIDNNKSTHADRLDPKNAIKINRIKDEYIDFLQKQYEDNNKINFSLDSNNKDLLRKCNDLIQDNIILNKTVSDRTNKLNKSIQENMIMKSQLDKTILNSKKNEQKILYYEEQLKLFKSNNANYQNIIQDLKDQNQQLNLNINKLKNANEEEQKKMEEQLRIKIEEIKKNLEESYNEKIQEINKHGSKIKDLLEQIKILKDKNNELLKELKKKENIIELMYKDNEKLVNQNNLNNIQIEQHSKQINDLNQIIQHKEILINSLKNKEVETEKILNQTNSQSVIKLENSDFLSENITKLINDNEENKIKIEYLNDKLRTIHEIEKKYNELMGDKKNITYRVPNNTSYMVRNTVNSVTSPKIKINSGHTIYISKLSNSRSNSLNNSRTSCNNNSEKRINIQDIKLKYSRNSYDTKNKNKYVNINGNEINYKKKPILANTSLPLKTIDVDKEIRSINMKQNEKSERIITDYKENSGKKKEQTRNKKNASVKFNKNNNTYINNKNRIIEIDVRKNNVEKKEKSSDKIIASKIPNNVIFKGRNFFKKGENKSKGFNWESPNYNEQYDIEIEKRTIHGKELEEDVDEVKDNIRKLNRKKNFTYKPNETNLSLENSDKGQEIENENEVNNNVNKNKNTISYYLYGIDRNDFLHIFDINNKKWVGKKKIFEIDLEDKSDSFRKDYQYEGTLLYNMLEGVFILTGESTDTLYYFDSKTNSISKICKFNYCHDNGSIMYDENTDCLYVFGGKNITSCEYYSFIDEKIYKLPNLISDRANGSFIISNNKIFGFFGFSYKKETYVKTIEYIDYYKKDKWIELNDIKLLKENINFDIESVSTMYYKQNKDKILIYSGIQGEDEEFVTDYYLLYDARNNTMDKINKWNLNQYKHLGVFWKDYTLKKNDPKGFHFAKNSRFILLPKNCICEGYNSNDKIDILIDYKNNVHFILQGKEKIDIYRGEI